MITYQLNKPRLDLARYFAKFACIGGVSRVRSGNSRQNNLKEDQMIGQIGELCLSLYYDNSLVGYISARKSKNKNPTLGDKGSDLPGILVDVKTSWKTPSRAFLDHRLAVRPDERHVNCIYILALTDINNIKIDESCKCVFVGWLPDSGLPDKPHLSGEFRGAYLVNGSDLNPMPNEFAGLPFTTH